MSYRPAIASVSLGKFAAAAAAGIAGIEIFYEDLEYLAASNPGGLTEANEMTAARQIRYLCDTLSLDIIAVGPFTDYEGRLDPSARATKLKELDLWFRVANTLGTRLIQIPCTFMVEGVAGDPAVAASDLRRLADIGATQTPPFRFAYENLCWGTYNDTWEKAWGIIKVVDGDNFGMCLDTFNIAGREWADPASPSGMVDNADQLLAESLRIMVQEVDVQKVFYVQAVDAERLERPLDTLHELQVDGQKPRMGWSRNC